MKQLWEFGNFVRGLRTRMRFGEFSRAPLRLLRLQLQDEKAECDWLARSPDEWDAALRPLVREQQASLQALHDAMKLREMLFDALPVVRTGELRAFRQSAREPPYPIIIGTVTREEPAENVKKISSIAMRAKLYGFKFWLEDGVLVPLESIERRLGFAT
jgi:hypothetical protein